MFADCFLPSSANCPANAQTQPSTLSLHSAVSTVDEEPMNIIQGDLVHATPPPAHARTHTHTHTHTHTKRHICTYIRAHIQAYAHTCECVRGGASKRETLSARESARESVRESVRERKSQREREREREREKTKTGHLRERHTKRDRETER